MNSTIIEALGLSNFSTVNQHEAFAEALTYAKMGIHQRLVGGAGVGKTYLATQVAKALGLDFYLVSYSKMSTLFELKGGVSPIDPKLFYKTPFYEAFINGGLVLFDEADRAAPALLTAINAALANGEYTFGNSPKPVKMHKDFRIMMATNTDGVELSDKYPDAVLVDTATADRFGVCIYMDLDEGLETRLFGKVVSALSSRIRKFVNKKKTRLEVTMRLSESLVKVKKSPLTTDMILKNQILPLVPSEHRGELEKAIYYELRDYSAWREGKKVTPKDTPKVPTKKKPPIIGIGDLCWHGDELYTLEAYDKDTQKVTLKPKKAGRYIIVPLAEIVKA